MSRLRSIEFDGLFGLSLQLIGFRSRMSIVLFCAYTANNMRQLRRNRVCGRNAACRYLPASAKRIDSIHVTRRFSAGSTDVRG